MNDALDLVCENLQETPTNNKAVFAKWKRGLPLGSFTSALMTAWEHADGENQRRLAMAFPQIASAILYGYCCLRTRRQNICDAN